MSDKPRIALIGTGGTITSVGRHSLDMQDYTITGQRMHPDEMLTKFPEAAAQADVIPLRYKAIPSPEVGPADWQALVETIQQAASADHDLAGFVILHGTATLEETAYALNLLVKVDKPVVLVGAQRPASGLSSDAGMNLTNAIRVAADPASRGMGVLVVINDEIQAAREVTKTSTYRLQTFRTPDFGVLGHADVDSIHYYRKPTRKHTTETEFRIDSIRSWPRVDIVTSYAGADATAINAFLAAGAKGLVSAALAPGYNTPDEVRALADAVASGVPVVQSTRAGSGRVYMLHKGREAGFISADNLSPQKARVLLACALTVSQDPADIARMFASY